MSLRTKPQQTRKKTLMPFEIVIACVQPVSVVMSHALVFCRHYHLPAKHITLFFQTLEEATAARRIIPVTSVGRIIAGVSGAGALYNFIFRSYPETKPLVFIHEGITGVYEYSADANSVHPLTSMIGLIRTGFSESAKAESGLWGIYPAVSSVNMSDAVNIGLKRISNQVWGCMNPGSMIERKQSGFEEYELPILFYQMYGTIVRLQGFAANTLRDTTGGANTPPSPRKFSQMYSAFSRVDSKGNLRLIAMQETTEEKKEAFPV
jgi:hypothetical protein